MSSLAVLGLAPVLSMRLTQSHGAISDSASQGNEASQRRSEENTTLKIVGGGSGDKEVMRMRSVGLKDG